ncbi:MAG: DEAD/DEAH box helicase, partial [Mangrovibacterium sp.]
MDLQEFRLYFQQNITLHSVLDQLDSPGKKFHLKGLSGSSRTLFSAALSEHLHKPVLYLLPNREEAAYFYDDLINLGTGVPVLFFPASCRRPVQFDRPDQENIILRTSVLNQLLQPEPFSIVSYPEALAEKVITGETLSAHSFQIRKGDRLSIDFLNDVLYEYGFERVDFVTEAGQFALRGSLVDVFSFSEEDPYRIDFLNDRIDSIRLFGVADQISVSQADQMVIIPDIQNSLEGENRDQFLNLLPPGSVVVSQDVSLVSGLIDDLNRQARFAGMDEPGLRLSSGSEFLDLLNRFTCLEAGIKCHFPDAVPFEFHTAPQPVFHKNFELLAKNLQKRACSGYHNFILSSNEKQIERIKAIFEAQGLDVPFTGLGLTLHEGFLDHELKLCCYTDHQIFERYHRFRIKSRKDQKENLSLKELNTLHPGDYVVHIDHGIGKFAGLVKTRINGKMQETIRLVYRDNDVLLVSIHSLHRITRYKGKDGLEPKINKLGSGAWQKLKDRTKSKVKDIARELIALYALRKQEKGFAYSADSYMQKELEASFIFEDTPDQTKATQAVKEDMEKPIPMDRLVCGDVGFGKTEIAIRAAFKAIADGKQVAVLVPTTILALQHYRTFSDRLNNFPVKLDHISRLRQPAEIKDILKQLREGRIDLLIGTHRLIGKDVKFKDLGLLIVDEEQKFGVSVKEKLKQLKVNVDTLTLTAT